MLPDQFFYWLQGYFEISGSGEPLTAAQAECITRHIELVTEWARGDGARRDPIAVPERIIEIRTLLGLLADADGVSPAYVTARVRDTVNAQFQHVIDPKAGDAKTQAALNAIHGSGHGPGHAPVYRC